MSNQSLPYQMTMNTNKNTQYSDTILAASTKAVVANAVPIGSKASNTDKLMVALLLQNVQDGARFKAVVTNEVAALLAATLLTVGDAERTGVKSVQLLTCGEATDMLSTVWFNAYRNGTTQLNVVVSPHLPENDAQNAKDEAADAYEDTLDSGSHETDRANAVVDDAPWTEQEEAAYAEKFTTTKERTEDAFEEEQQARVDAEEKRLRDENGRFAKAKTTEAEPGRLY